MKERRRVISAVLLALLLSAGACGGAAEIRGNSSADRLSEETENGSRDETDGFESTDGKASNFSSEAENSSFGASSEDSPEEESSSDSSEEVREVLFYLHFNSPFPVADKVLVGTQSGETAELDNAENAFIKLNEKAAQAKLLTTGVEPTSEPVYHFSGWAYDRDGERPFDGLVPDCGEIALYAVWTRSQRYVKLSLYGDKEFLDAYYLVKDTTFTQAAADKIAGRYAELGIETDGLYTSDGKPFAIGGIVGEDAELFPRPRPACRHN